MERRRTSRLGCDDRLCIQTVTSSQGPCVTTVFCSATDVSEAGIRVCVDDPVPVGCLLELWVEIAGRAGRFLLTGLVRWSEQTSEGGTYLLGIELHENSENLVEWRDLFN